MDQEAKINQILESLSWLTDAVIDMHEALYEHLNKGLSNKKKDTESHNLLKTYFMEWYDMTFKNAYYWQAKDSVAIHRIIKKIIFKFNSKNGRAPEKEEVLTAFKMVIENINDDWILSRISVTMVDGKFNELVSQLRNDKQRKREQRASEAEAAFAKHGAGGTQTS